MPSRCAIVTAASSASDRDIPLTRSRPSVMLRNAVMFGNRLYSWNTMAIWERTCQGANAGFPDRMYSCPSSSASPVSGSSRRQIQRSRVLLPLPLRPITASVSPRATAMSTPDSTGSEP